MPEEIDKSRSTSPESPLANSFHHASNTVDDLTLALANFSRVPSPEPPIPTCCCGREDCESTRAWQELKSRLESRLILSAEVGQALLQRHEAYVRRHEGRVPIQSPAELHGNHAEEDSVYDPSVHEISELIREKARLEKRLNQVLVNNEVTEVSTKTIMHELHEARGTISRLTAQHARSVGWETRLSAAVREKDDMQQERDGEANRAKLAESRLATMKDKTVKLQREVRRLQETLEERRFHRLESSENILQDARVRLEALNSSQLGQTALVERTELTNVLESLVSDNEILKRDNAELQNMLTESREEIHALHEEVEEFRVRPPSSNGVVVAGTPRIRRHYYTNSVPGSVPKDHPLQHFKPRSISVDKNNRRSFEPLTPETTRRPLSPPDSLASSEARRLSLSQPRPGYPSSHVSIEIEESFADNDDDFSSPEKPKALKPLLLLSRSRGVQTETWPGQLSPLPLTSHLMSTSPHDPRSESSSFSDTLSSHLSVLLDRISGLHTRMSQADAITLTNRLKRQHLKGADVGHLSRTTVNNIVTESSNLRAQFRFLLEDDSMVIPCTRKDFRVLFKVCKDMFTDMGEMRVVLNDIILDPSCASKLSERTLNPNKIEEELEQKERDSAGNVVASSWMAPISKLFTPTAARGETSVVRPGLVRTISGRGSTRPLRPMQKSGPALSASTTTVNVEFSGTAVGRSTTSTVASHANQWPREFQEPTTTSHNASAVMKIFAGAPQKTPDPWVVVPHGPRRVQSFMKPSVSDLSTTTIGRSAGRINAKRISQNVDAVIDMEGPVRDEETDYLAPLLHRTLRRRGMSDSSIHSTFTSQTTEDAQPSPLVNPSDISMWPDRHTVFQNLSRTIQTLRNTATGSVALSDDGELVAPVAIASPPKRQPSQPAHPPRVASPGIRNLLPNLSSWAAAGNILEPTPEPFLVGSVRDDSFMPPRSRRPGESHGHDYF